MGDWSEIENLSNFFKKIQEDTHINRLSDNNCIEIVNKLSGNNLIQLIFTTDGKEFITPKHLIKEIKEELQASGGRINVVDLATILKLDLNHIQNAVTDLLKQDNSLKFILGQIISKQYEQSIAEEVNQKLSLHGIFFINDLAKSFDLPGEYIHNVIKHNLLKTIHGIYDNDAKTLYTENYVNSQKCKLRGLLIATTKPMNLEYLTSHYQINENLIINLVEKLIVDNEVRGILQGNKKDKLIFIKYIPLIFTNMQRCWVLSYYSQNKYLEYDGLHKISIFDPKTFVTKILNEELNDTNQIPIFLNDSCIHQSILDTILSNIEINLSSSHYCDILEMIPSFMTIRDAQTIVNLFRKCPIAAKYKFIDDATFLWDSPNVNTNETLLLTEDATFLLAKCFIISCSKLFSEPIKEKAQKNFQSHTPYLLFDEDVENVNNSLAKVGNKNLVDNGFANENETNGVSRKEERKKRSSTKNQGGGSQNSRAREHKTKSVTSGKNVLAQQRLKNLENSKNESGSPAKEIAFDIDDIREKISENVFNNFRGREDAGDERLQSVLDLIGQILSQPINQEYEEECKRLYLTSVTCKRVETKQEMEKIQERINELYHKITVFQKGVQLFISHDKIKDDLNKYLLKTVGCELFEQLLIICKLQYSQTSHQKGPDITNTTTIEGRRKAIMEFPDAVKTHLSNISKTLVQNDASAFLNELLDISQTNSLNIILKKLDKKKEKVIVQNYRQELLEKLKAMFNDLSESNAPLKFHLLTLITFCEHTKSALCASGKFVPNMIDQLALLPSIPPEIKEMFMECQRLIISEYSTSHQQNGSADGDREINKNHVDEDVLTEKLLMLKNSVLKE
ncbi:unnamed protein product [Gordionus sp. m RMFG-2023]|uniref:E3 UFM1-protein ligase 1-like n=1 Tax=Gordionus sp. m RMFG-2023 TaxID=3053472 RepID=UPI0030E15864